jgi:hypothetical protein
MDVKWDIELKDWQTENPILECVNINRKFDVFDADTFDSVLNGKAKQQLKTWGGAESTSEPHWIGVTHGTPLHTDPRYPRYSWQLMIWVDDFVLRGLNKVETPLEMGTLFLLDTHSPHQLWAKSKNARYYLACSMDSKEKIPMGEAITKLTNFADNNPLLNNTKRITK